MPKTSAGESTVSCVASSLRRSKLQPVNIRSRLREQRGLLGLAIGCRNPLEGVEDHLVAALALVRRKVALEHRAVGPERLDAGLDIGAPRGRCFLGGGRFCALVKIVTQ